MEVNINNLRKQTAYTLHRLIKILNAGILPNEDDGTGLFNSETEINITVEKLEETLDRLRQYVIALLCCYEEGNPNLKDLSEEVDIDEFNPKK
ncbi:MAG: hypothetical protein LBN27_12210 [Prevotellaceae bacterium]|jgi:hypothetical protein|nr:hypothetical protein [Prevotellaceae bacterium]